MPHKSVFYLQEAFNSQKIIEFVTMTSKFSSDVYIQVGNNSYNSKAILGVVNLILTLKKGEKFTVSVNGEDAEYAEVEIKEFFAGLKSPHSTNKVLFKSR
ncbi:HPr family phosphocarrier protein [Salipaludibacillus neizhouensis]|nr:HPr family phosphocarrier protein [Salipaludibacillus neizhouensis]